MPWQRKIDYQEAEMLLRDGLALQAIADRLKVSTSAIRNISKRLGIFSPPGRRRKADYDLVLGLRASGLTHAEIAQRVGLSRSRVSYILRQNGHAGRRSRSARRPKSVSSDRNSMACPKTGHPATSPTVVIKPRPVG